MPQAIPVIQAAGAYLASQAVIASLIRVILVNVALGSFEYDDGCTTWVAIDGE